jgi:PAS domain S-box-containing protein
MAKPPAPPLNEKRLQLLIDSVTDYAIFVLDPDGKVASWNPGAERIKGYKAQEIIGTHFSVFYPSDQRAAGHPEEELETAAREGRYAEEGWRLRKDGSRFWASVVITALRDDSGTLVGYAKVTRDLTERRVHEEQLRASEERLRLLIASVKDYAIFMLDPQGRIETWNPGAERLKGYKKEEIVGRHFSTFYPQADLDAGKPAHELEIAAETGRFEDEGWRRRKDGSRFWANVIISAVRDEKGQLVGFSKVTRDLTERRKSDLALKHALETVRRSNAELDEYASFVSHDLQEPLRKMSSFSDLLLLRFSAEIPAEGKDYLNYITDGARRMRRLIVDLLEYSRLGRESMPKAKVDLAEVLSETLRDLELPIKESGAEISVGPLPTVPANRTALGRVFLNLLSNALKFRAAGRNPSIRVSCARQDGDCVVTIHDNGIGFEQDQAENIMRPFRRLHSKTEYPGSGIGLAAAQKIIQGHGGRLWASSTPGQGSTFYLSLPCE